jgi:hypothetical protein
VTSAHIFFIPGMILIGMIAGFIFGARAARNQIDIQARRDAERESARAARAAKRSVTDDKPPAEAKPVETTAAEAKEPAADDNKDDNKVEPKPDKTELPTTPVKVKGKKR